MGKKRKYVSPLLLQMSGGGSGEIIVEGSVETGGTLGGECWDLQDMFGGQPAAKIVGCDGTLLGYLDIDKWEAWESPCLWDRDGNPVDNFMEDYMMDVDWWLEDQEWSCYVACPELED